MSKNPVTFARRQADWIYDRFWHSRMSVKRLGARLGTDGKAEASMFFDSFPRFYETTQTRSAQGRLNLRYEAIFAQNADIFEGARVLDIASHDGRWSLAALHAGAAEVIGIEARDDLVESARESLDRLAPPGKKYEFRAGDVFQVLAEETFDVDVVLCLGFLYHTLRYNELMRRIRDLDPRYLVVDTARRASSLACRSSEHGAGRPGEKRRRRPLLAWGSSPRRTSLAESAPADPRELRIQDRAHLGLGRADPGQPLARAGQRLRDPAQDDGALRLDHRAGHPGWNGRTSGVNRSTGSSSPAPIARSVIRRGCAVGGSTRQAPPSSNGR